MPSTLVPQGTLNRLRTSLIINNNTALNVTSGYLGKRSISITYDGKAAMLLGTLTGNVSSQQPYLTVTMRVNLVRSQALAQSYKSQMELNSFLGDSTLRSDSGVLTAWSLQDTTITDISDLNFDGENPDYLVEMMATYHINSDLFTT